MPTPKTVVSLLTEDQDFQVAQAADAEAAAKRAGVAVDVVFARNNRALQAEQLYKYVHAPAESRPVAFVVQTVAGDNLPRVAAEAAKAGIGWLLLNRDADYVAQLRAEYPKLPIGIVTIDQTAIGKIQGQQLRALLPRGGSVLYVQGPAETSAAVERQQGVQEVIAGANIVLHVLHCEWTAGSSEKALVSWFRLSSSRDFHPNLIAAQNDAMAMGAKKAISAARPEWLSLPFIGCDGLPDGGQRLVRERELTATIVVPTTAGAAINYVTTQSRNGTPGPVRTVLTAAPFPAVLVPRSAL